MAVYGITAYGSDVYGLSLPPAYRVDPFVAQSVDYGTIRLTWEKPSGTMLRYRLLANRYGYPVNENDGTLLLDSVTYPGGAYFDKTVIPGTYHYYGFYVLVDETDNIWIRSAVTGCLAIKNCGSAQMLWDRLPDYFRYIPETGGELTGNASGNSYLQQFLNVLGFGMDYLHTQYQMLDEHFNDPMAIPVDDLWNLAAELGLNFSPELPAYTVRKAVLNQAHVCRERGTTLGLDNEITLRTGWSADIQSGPNLMLADDQSMFLNPVFLPWTPCRPYLVGECVWIGPARTSRRWAGHGYWYQCTAAHLNFAPPGDGTSNGFWAPLRDLDDFLFTLTNLKTGHPSTWEAVDTSAGNGVSATGTLTQGLGVPNLTGDGFAWNSLRAVNSTGSTRTYMLRSVPRTVADLSLLPDPGFNAGTTVIEIESVPDPTWVPASWPRRMVTIPGFPGQRHSPGQYNAAAYWITSNGHVIRSGTASRSGPWGAILTPGGTTLVFTESPWVSAPGGDTVTASVWLRAPATLTQPVTATLQWIDLHGQHTTEVDGTPVTLVAGTYTQVTVSGTAPAKNMYALLRVRVADGCALTDILHFTDLSFTVGTPAVVNTPASRLRAIEDGIPVPWVRDTQSWKPGTRYGTGDIVLCHGQAFTALRASTGAQPPANDQPTAEWAPLSENRRIRLAVSGYASQNQSVSTNWQVPTTPFVEFYDSSGNYITRLLARNPLAAGAVGKPDQLIFDSFTGVSRVFNTTAPASAVLGPWQATFWQSDVPLTGIPAATRTDASINFSLNGVPPAPGVGSSGWSARWTTSFTPPASGTYTFSLNGQGGGTRLLVNGQIVINDWIGTPVGPQSGTIQLTGGSPVTVEVDYWAPEEVIGDPVEVIYEVAWVPLGYSNSAELPAISVIAGAAYSYLAELDQNNSLVTASITWYSHGRAVGTTESVTGLQAATVTGTVPNGVNSAVLYLTTSRARGSYAVSFIQFLSGPVPAALSVTSPVPFTSSGTMLNTSTLTGRVTEDNVAAWATPAGNFAVGNGAAWPLTPGQRSIGLVTGPANTQLGVTFRTQAQSGQAQGIVFRYTDDTHYWRCSRTDLRKKNAGVWTTVATHSTAFADNDRMTVVLSGSSIKVLRNAVATPVSTATDTFNSSATKHGIICEAT